MNTSNNKVGVNRRWWQGWFAEWCLNKRDTRNVTRASLWSAAFFVLLAAGIVTLDPSPGDYRSMPLWQWALALSPIIPGLVAFLAWMRFMREAEELYRWIHIEAAATGFVVGLILFLCLGIVGNIFGEAQGGDALVLVFVITVFAFIFSLRARMRKYDE